MYYKVQGAVSGFKFYN